MGNVNGQVQMKATTQVKTTMMLEDEVLLACPALFEIHVHATRTTCSLHDCAGHTDPRELTAIHDAIESCYASLRD